LFEVLMLTRTSDFPRPLAEYPGRMDTEHTDQHPDPEQHDHLAELNYSITINDRAETVDQKRLAWSAKLESLKTGHLKPVKRGHLVLVLTICDGGR